MLGHVKLKGAILLWSVVTFQCSSATCLLYGPLDGNGAQLGGRDFRQAPFKRAHWRADCADNNDFLRAEKERNAWISSANFGNSRQFWQLPFSASYLHWVTAELCSFLTDTCEPTLGGNIEQRSRCDDVEFVGVSHSALIVATAREHSSCARKERVLCAVQDCPQR